MPEVFHKKTILHWPRKFLSDVGLLLMNSLGLLTLTVVSHWGWLFKLDVSAWLIVSPNFSKRCSMACDWASFRPRGSWAKGCCEAISSVLSSFSTSGLLRHVGPWKSPSLLNNVKLCAGPGVWGCCWLGRVVRGCPLVIRGSLECTCKCFWWFWLSGDPDGLLARLKGIPSGEVGEMFGDGATEENSGWVCPDWDWVMVGLSWCAVLVW